MKHKVSTSQKPKTWKVLLSSLIKNDAVVEGGRFHAWWIALIIAALSVVIALVPTMVNIGTTKGSDIFKKTQYNYDVGVLKLSESLAEKGVDLTVQEVTVNDKVSYRLTNVADNFATTYTDKVTLDTTDYHYFNHKGLDTVDKLHVFYVKAGVDDPATKADETSKDFMNLLNNYLQKLVYNPKNTEEPGVKPVNFIVFGPESFQIALYNPMKDFKGSTPSYSLSGRYTKAMVGKDISKFATTSIDGTSITTLKASAATYDQYRAAVDANWADFYVKGYEPVRTATFWTNTGVFFGTYIAITLFMGLVIFIMTRGKASPTRDWTFGQSMAISCWSVLSPAILTLVLGFILPQFASMAFIMLVGMRIMWMSMRQIRPAPPAPSK